MSKRDHFRFGARAGRALRGAEQPLPDFVYFTQVAIGLPVFMGTVGVHLNGRNQVIGVDGDFFPGIRPPTEALLSAAGALGTAADSIGAPPPTGQSGIEGQESLFERGNFLDPIRVGRTLYPYHPDSPFTDPRGIQAGEILYWLLRADDFCSAGPTSYGTSGGSPNYRQPLDAGAPCPN